MLFQFLSLAFLALLRPARRPTMSILARSVGGATGLILLSCLYSAPALASHICPSGPGPGEVQVGMTNQSGGGMVPVCEATDDGPRSDSNSSSIPNLASKLPDLETHAVMVWHPDVANVWIAGGYVTDDSVENSKGTKALGACTQMMGSGCISVWEWWNSEIVVLRNRNGSFSMSELPRAQLALNECSETQILPCEIFRIDASESRSLNETARKSYAVAAWVEGKVTDGKLYVAAGHSNWDAATAAAIKACGTATARKCEVATWSGSGFIQAYRLNGGHSYGATAETTADRAKEAAQLSCKKSNSPTCELQAQFDSKTPGLFVLDFNTGETKTVPQ